MVNRTLLSLLAAVMFACTSGGGATSGGDPITAGPQGTLTIDVRLHPLGPVELVGHELTSPVRDAVISIRTLQDVEILQLHTDAAGLVQVTLTDGEYRLDVLSCPGGRLPDPVAFSVQGGASTPLQINCDTERQ